MGARFAWDYEFPSQHDQIDCATADAYVLIALQPDFEVDLFFPFRVASSGEIIFIGADATEEAATTVVAG